jgi:hypothetical protein
MVYKKVFEKASCPKVTYMKIGEKEGIIFLFNFSPLKTTKNL